VEYNLNKDDQNMIIMMISVKYSTATVYYLYYIIILLVSFELRKLSSAMASKNVLI